MRFKLVHVKPHVWFFKQKETLAAKATSEDSSSTEGPFVYKRTTSLKLVKSKPSANRASASSDNGGSAQKQGKNVEVCTVVDAGCTCRATVSSQHKQKRGMASTCVSSRDMAALHDMCRPRRTQVLEAKGDRDDAEALRRHVTIHPKSTSNPSHSPGTNGSMMSRLVCKSSNDVISRAQVDADHNRVICASLHDDHMQANASILQVRDLETRGSQMDVHELECRLRNAGLEERKRSSKKKNKLFYEDGSLTSSGISSSVGTSANTDTMLTSTTSEMQDMLLNVNPAFDTNMASTGDHRTSLDDLRVSIVQKKLANLSPRASLCAENLGFLDGMSEDVAFSSSPSSLSSENVRSMSVVSPRCILSPTGQVYRKNLDMSPKHVDIGVNKRVCMVESHEVVSEGTVKQSHRASSFASRKVKESAQERRSTPRRAARRIDMGMQKETDFVHQHDNAKSRGSRSNACLGQGERHGLSRFSGGLAHGGMHPHEANSKEAGPADVPWHGCSLGYPEGDFAEEKQVVSSSSCEIQVLSDNTHDNQSDAGRKHPMPRNHVGGASLMPPADRRNAGAHKSEEGSRMARELMGNDNAVAMVKTSYDPRHDFKESMLEMVVAKHLRTPTELQQLLQCYLSLNAPHYHPTIIKVFHEVCSQLFN